MGASIANWDLIATTMPHAARKWARLQTLPNVTALSAKAIFPASTKPVRAVKFEGSTLSGFALLKALHEFGQERIISRQFFCDGDLALMVDTNVQLSVKAWRIGKYFEQLYCAGVISKRHLIYPVPRPWPKVIYVSSSAQSG